MVSLQSVVVDTLRTHYDVRVQQRPFTLRQAIGPRYKRIPLELAAGERVQRVQARAPELAVLAGEDNCEVYVEEGCVWVAFPRREFSSVMLYEALTGMPRRPSGYAAIGVDMQTDPVGVFVPDTPHILISGTSGAGKTVAQKAIIASLAWWSRPSEANFLLCDVKGGESFDVFGGERSGERLVHLLHPVITETSQMVQYIAWLAARMEDRQAKRINRPRIYLVVDELADVLTLGGRLMEGVLKRILERGRSAGVHIIAATNQAGTQSMGKLAGLFKYRIALSQVRSADAFTATTVGKSGAHRLRMGGDMLVGEQQTRVQGYLVDDMDVRRLLAKSYLPSPVLQTRTITLAQAPALAIADEAPAVGRPAVPVDQAEIDACMTYRATHGKWPSPHAVTRGALGGKRMGQLRAARIIQAAQERTGEVDEPVES